MTSFWKLPATAFIHSFSFVLDSGERQQVGGRVRVVRAVAAGRRMEGRGDVHLLGQGDLVCRGRCQTDEARNHARNLW